MLVWCWFLAALLIPHAVFCRPKDPFPCARLCASFVWIYNYIRQKKRIDICSWPTMVAPLPVVVFLLLFDTEADGCPWGFSPVQPESGGKPCPSMCLAKHRSANMEGKKKNDPGAGILLTLKSWMKSVISPSYRQYTNCTIWNWSGFLKKGYTSDHTSTIIN